MFDMRSSWRRVARFITRPTLARMKPATGTSTSTTSVSCQLMKQAMTTQASALRGSATTLPNRVFRPLPSESMSLVNRAISSLVPCSLNWLTSRWMALR
jgi:hypothetical protein